MRIDSRILVMGVIGLLLVGAASRASGSKKPAPAATRENPVKISAQAKEIHSAASMPKIMTATPAQLKILEQFQKRLLDAGQVTARISRKTTIGLLGQEKLASGELLISKGKIRMDLKVEGDDERQLLVVGDKRYWAVTYPSKELGDAAVQVVVGKVKSKKKASAGILAVLGGGGFLKSFSVSAVSLDKDGGIRYYLQPKTDWVEAKRALVALGPENKGPQKTDALLGTRDFREIKIWDFQDNETDFTLHSVEVLKSAPSIRKFEFAPPKGADILTMPE